MHKRWSRVIFSSRSLIAVMLAVQVLFTFSVFTALAEYSSIITSCLSIISLLVVFHIAITNNDGPYKVAWILLVLFVPVFGGLFYVLFKGQSSMRRFSSRLKGIAASSKGLSVLSGDHLDDFEKDFPEYAPQVKYLRNTNDFSPFKNTETTYLTPGEVKLEHMLEEMKKAEKYIFLEYFIVNEGIMWNSILAVLKERAAAGVDVRVLYDDMGCFFYLKDNYAHELSKYGIKCAAFNPFRPFLTAKQNNRDHRKIAVIDGKVAFTGGINLADWYINAVKDQRYWKDAAVMLRGEAAWGFTLLFLQMWTLSTGRQENYKMFYPWKDAPCPIKADGYVVPYADAPIDNENTGSNVYIQIINNAKKYVYITTPYLIIDDSIINALAVAAKSGVDVRITTPHQSDSFLVHSTTRSYYKELIENGVKIYEYDGGIIHAKNFVADDKVATVGTTNLDFRSLYLHFECGALMYGCTAVKEVKDDFLEVLKDCKEITEADCKASFPLRLLQGILRLAAPLL